MATMKLADGTLSGIPLGGSVILNSLVSDLQQLIAGAYMTGLSQYGGTGGYYPNLGPSPFGNQAKPTKCAA